MSADKIRMLAEKVQVGIKGGHHGRAHETEIVLPEISMFDRMEISSALLAYAAMVERCEGMLKANSKSLKYRHKDADAALAYANYILKGVTNG